LAHYGVDSIENLALLAINDDLFNTVIKYNPSIPLMHQVKIGLWVEEISKVTISQERQKAITENILDGYKVAQSAPDDQEMRTPRTPITNNSSMGTPNSQTPKRVPIPKQKSTTAELMNELKKHVERLKIQVSNWEILSFHEERECFYLTIHHQPNPPTYIALTRRNDVKDKWRFHWTTILKKLEKQFQK
jgi:hypothetical protein